MQIHELTTLAATPATGTSFAVDTGTVTRKLDYATLAKAIVENYNGSVLIDDAQTIQNALNAVNTGVAGIKTALNDMEMRKSFAGSVIAASGSVADDIKLTTLYGKAVQDGTPTPTSPVAIGIPGAGGTLDVVSAGKNLASLTSPVRPQQVSVSYLNDEIDITATGTYGRVGFSIPVTVGQTYTISYRGKSDGDYKKVYLHSVEGWTSPTYAAHTLTADWATYTKTFTATTDVLFAGFYVTTTSTSGTMEIADFQVELGSTATAYEPYVGTTTSVPVPSTGLPGIKVSSGGNYTDESGQQWICDTIDMAAGTYTKRVGVVVLDDSQTPTISNSGGDSWYYNFSSIFSDAPAANNSNDKSSHYPRVAISNSNAVQGFTASGTWLRIRYGTQDTVENYKTWLAQNPVTVVYILATPVTTALTSEQISALSSLQSHDGNTIVYTEAGSDLTAKIFVNAGAYL